MPTQNLPAQGFKGSGSGAGERPAASVVDAKLAFYRDTSTEPDDIYIERDENGTPAWYKMVVLDANGNLPSNTGGLRQLLQWSVTNVAAGENATPANSTPVAAQWAGAAAVAVSFCAIRAGSITGLSAVLSSAAAGSDCIVGVYKNGTIINAAAIVTLASAKSDTEARGTFTAETYTFVAGDNIDVRIRTGSGWSATTADLGVALEIET